MICASLFVECFGCRIREDTTCCFRFGDFPPRTTKGNQLLGYWFDGRIEAPVWQSDCHTRNWQNVRKNGGNYNKRISLHGFHSCRQNVVRLDITKGASDLT